MFQKKSVIIFFLHEPNLLLVLDLPPGQLTNQRLVNIVNQLEECIYLTVGELYEHVEERPEVIMATHLLVLVSID